MGFFKKKKPEAAAPPEDEHENIFLDWDHHTVIHTIERADAGSYNATGRYPNDAAEKKFDELREKVKKIADEGDLNEEAARCLLHLVALREEECKLVMLRETRITRWRDALVNKADKELTERQLAALVEAEEQELSLLQNEIHALRNPRSEKNGKRKEASVCG